MTNSDDEFHPALTPDERRALAPVFRYLQIGFQRFREADPDRDPRHVAERDLRFVFTSQYLRSHLSGYVLGEESICDIVRAAARIAKFALPDLSVAWPSVVGLVAEPAIDLPVRDRPLSKRPRHVQYSGGALVDYLIQDGGLSQEEAVLGAVRVLREFEPLAADVNPKTLKTWHAQYRKTEGLAPLKRGRRPKK